MIRSRPNRVASMLLAGLVGCGGQPTRYEPHHEMLPGPGLFSGSSGEFSWRAGKEQAVVQLPRARPEEPAPEADAAELDSYRRYRRAKEAASDEWREFLEWQSWQAYLQWHRTQSSGPRVP